MCIGVGTIVATAAMAAPISLSEATLQLHCLVRALSLYSLIHIHTHELQFCAHRVYGDTLRKGPNKNIDNFHWLNAQIVNDRLGTHPKGGYLGNLRLGDASVSMARKACT